jgi:hypothetical protein
MANSSPKQKKLSKPAPKFKDADAFLDAVTPILIENLDRAASASRQKDTKACAHRTGFDKKPE